MAGTLCAIIGGSRVQNGPHVINDLTVGASDVEVKPVGVLAFDVPNERLAVAGVLHHSTDLVSPEECVELGDGPIEGLRRRLAVQLQVHLLRSLSLMVVRGHECCELLPVEGSVLDGRVSIATEETEEESLSQVELNTEGMP